MSKFIFDNSFSISNNCKCLYDNNEIFSSNFSTNGDVDGWNVYSNIHTYGCWNGFLFGSIYNSQAYIGREDAISTFFANDYYTIKITMKVTPYDSTHYPTKAKLQWKTDADVVWEDDRTEELELVADGDFHSYTLNMGAVSKWTGYITNLRFYPIFDGRENDEFFIRSIKVLSNSINSCSNPDCSYYNNYLSPCIGGGIKSSITSDILPESISVVENINDSIGVNIENYGYVELNIDSNTYTPIEFAMELNKKINSLSVGGYSESYVYINSYMQLVIESGVFSNTPIDILYNPLTEDLNFFDSNGEFIGTKVVGVFPSNAYIPKSKFYVSNSRLINLFNNNFNEVLNFNPGRYSIEAGRDDWNTVGLGDIIFTPAESSEYTSLAYRGYTLIENNEKTIIDSNHPFNNSGMINKIFIAGTLYKETVGNVAEYNENAMVLILRPKLDGSLAIIHTIEIPDRDDSNYYSTLQESIELDCELFVNRGDLIGLYNVNLYTGYVNVLGDIDASYYQIDGCPTTTFTPGILKGTGSAGLLFYARSSYLRDTLSITVDLGYRYNIEALTFNSSMETSEYIEYNIASCLDINWKVDLFNGTHTTGYYDIYSSAYREFEHYNIAYGVNKLSDGIIINDSIAWDSYTTPSEGELIVSNPSYFFVNGDCEWLGIYQHTGADKTAQYVSNFEDDPIAFTIYFPNNLKKDIFKSCFYFKEKSNFRNIALSYYVDPHFEDGTADNPNFNLIPTYTSVTTDYVRYTEDSSDYENVALYLFSNPAIAKPILEYGVSGSTVTVTNYDQYIQAGSVDWTYIEHEFSPIHTNGFRVYTDYHKSTKINELELYVRTTDYSADMVGSVDVTFSDYTDIWIDSDIDQVDSSVIANINSAPRYLNIDINPIKEMNISDILISIDDSNFYVGAKGCETEFFPNTAAPGSNTIEEITVKNIYGKSCDLVIDIPNDVYSENKLLFYSTMNNVESINIPKEGPPAAYTKASDYYLNKKEKICSTNSTCYGLKNLVDSKEAYYSVDDGFSWYYYGVLSHDQSVSFNNAPDVVMTKLTIPNISKNQYWKIAPLCPELVYNVRELSLNTDGTRIDATYYYDEGLPISDGSISNNAPHISNGSIIGSYYELSIDSPISFIFNNQQKVDELSICHDAVSEYNDTIGGIDLYTVFNPVFYNNNFIDYSYYENNIVITGSGVEAVVGRYCDYGISFNGNDYIEIEYDENIFNIKDRRFTIDTNIKFELLPASGDYVVIAGNWLGDIDELEEVTGDSSKSWAFILRNSVTYGYRLQLWINYQAIGGITKKLMLDYAWTPVLDTWYNIACRRGDYFTGITSYNEFRLIIDGVSVTNATLHSSYDTNPLVEATNDINIAMGLHGVIDNFRISRGTTDNTLLYGSRMDGYIYFTKPYERYYTFLIYNSIDGVSYNEYCRIDPVMNSPFNYHTDTDFFNNTFNSYFVIDLLTHHDLDIVRNYGDATTYSIGLTNETAFSNQDIYDVDDVLFDGVSSDVRWVRIKMLNGDGISRTLDKIGIYPDITKRSVALYHNLNNEWVNLGNDISDYIDDVNIAVDATISGSSYFGDFKPTFITNGDNDLTYGSLTNVWGCEDTTPELLLDFGEPYDIYKIKMYHGYNINDSNYMTTDYNIYYSEDGDSFTLLFSITGNTDFIRTHILSESVSARFVKLIVTSYDSAPAYSYDMGNFFNGLVLREIEIYKDYGYNIISSEDYPIICLDLRERFFITDWATIGTSSSTSTSDWGDSLSNLYFSNSNTDYIDRAYFSDIGEQLYQSRYIAIKCDTATNHNSGPNYLKHFNIIGDVEYNVCNYYYWWNSTLSELSSGNIIGNEYSDRLLKITYPSSTILDTIYNAGGDNFGIDSNLTIRDALHIRMYIENPERINFSHGNFYLSGIDGTEHQNPIKYYWELSTLSGTITYGWNDIYLQFIDAEIDYVEDKTQTTLIDNRILNKITFDEIGLVIGGLGESFDLYLDGFSIKRNHFLTNSKFDKGLYLALDDYMEVTLPELNMNNLAIEFYLTANYDVFGSDIFNEYKNRVLFHVGNNSNDIFGAIFTSAGLLLYFGNLYDNINSLLVGELSVDILNKTQHFAFVVSNNGTGISSKRETIRFYHNSVLKLSTNYSWDVKDNSNFKVSLGGKGSLVNKELMESSSVDGVVSCLKIHNYCKVDFSSAVGQSAVEYTDNSLISPSELIEISLDNVTFYKVGDVNLPLTIRDIPSETEVPIYVKTVIPDNLTGRENRTANIFLSWDIGV